MVDQAQPAWFDALLQQQYRPLVAFVRGMLGDAQAANDITQDVFVAAWRATQQRKAPFAPAFDALGARRWLFRVAYRQAISARRHNTVIAWESLDGLEEPPSSHATPSPFEERVVESEALATALACLAPADAACILLHVVHGFTTAEVAETLTISPVAARKRLWRATERLRVAYLATNEAPVGRQGRR